MDPIRTTKIALKRLLLDRQRLLEPPIETDSQVEGKAPGDGMRQCVLDVIRQLEAVQIDPVAAVRANQHLALAARIAGYEPEALNALLRDHEVFEYIANAACILPMEDYPIFEPIRQRMRQQTQASIESLQPVIGQVLERLDREGPLPAKSFDSEQRVHGYWDDANATAKTKASSLALHLLTDAAEIRIVGREGNQRLFHTALRSVPAELLRASERIDPAEALDAMLRKYFRAFGVFEPSDPRFGWQRLSAQERRHAAARHVEAGTIVPVAVEGLKQPYYILASDRERLSMHETEAALSEDRPIRFLPPLDNLLWSRKRLEELFDFTYRWEIYTPAVKRTYGYYAMPILDGDRLIGRMDPRLDTKKRHLSVQLLQLEAGTAYNDRLRTRMELALDAFARTHGAETVSVERYAIEDTD
ncbi:DNA glycosylase AlkZ-like family protein [Paenibacillus sacheonensis]|uniref:Winged helix-turn-helix domain-containing protein n=1 Tax=Paenibacillus sacheonensis TaxID=742054 RepID=A0A7X5BZL0_9BACL|nr:crosslink repair DNA glycosylase YcaQ family protein [Paenibacillus sacheonensis]MBM7563124.1 uncharacterized protein YcaQ [Paenibacillus sacheonensis]NBC68310.1 winged helix-turn-helix domain-containing protein [Paenibacillus sacheonensis]